jgi:predicted nucleic acid-binding protein
MILSPSRLPEHIRPLVLDTGAALNLLATGQPAEVVRRLARPVLIEEVSANLLDAAPCRSPFQHDALRQLVDAGIITIERLDPAGYGTFLDIVGAPPPDDLGDGEAAALALALARDADVVVDEPKTTRIAASRLGRESLHSLDLICAPALLEEIGAERTGQLVLAAARDAHIRIPPRFRRWAADLFCAPRKGRSRTGVKPAPRHRRLRDQREGHRVDDRVSASISGSVRDLQANLEKF